MARPLGEDFFDFFCSFPYRGHKKKKVYLKKKVLHPNLHDPPTPW